MYDRREGAVVVGTVCLCTEYSRCIHIYIYLRVHFHISKINNRSFLLSLDCFSLFSFILSFFLFFLVCLFICLFVGWLMLGTVYYVECSIV